MLECESDGLANWVRVNTVVAPIENMIENIKLTKTKLSFVFFSRIYHLSVSATLKHQQAVVSKRVNFVLELWQK